ncbi:hypothetical protein [Streptomyces sp. NPDC056291]|uniref:hypothetical protein n=1 Tax=Streptomyces sp. NPDC056291 TaxID=3345772 RepID=UPI0035DDFF32
MNDELAERKAAAKKYDRLGVPLAFIAEWERTGGVTYESSAKTHALPLSLAPAAVKKAVKAADTAEQALEAADDKAGELWADYQGIRAQAQREVNAAIERGDSPPSLSALIDERQGAAAGAVIDAISQRDALRTKWAKARNAAENARERHRDAWRDSVTAHIAAETPKVQQQLQDAAEVVSAALNAAGSLSALADECRAVDRAWLEERLEASTYRISPNQTAQRPDIAIPEVYEQDRENMRQRAANTLGGRVLSAPVDIVGEVAKRGNWLDPLSKGGTTPDSLLVPLSSHPPVDRNWDDD